MIPLFEELVAEAGFISIDQMYNFIGISEMMPGAFAIDFAVFVGNFQIPIIGGILIFISVALPSFGFALISVTKGSKIVESKAFNSTMKYLRPAVIGLIFSVALMFLLKFVIGGMDMNSNFANIDDFRYKEIIVFVLILILGLFVKKIGPLFLILIAGALFLGLSFISL
jgi:chromate transport protein ChrA